MQSKQLRASESSATSMTPSILAAYFRWRAVLVFKSNAHSRFATNDRLDKGLLAKTDIEGSNRDPTISDKKKFRALCVARDINRGFSNIHTR